MIRVFGWAAVLVGIIAMAGLARGLAPTERGIDVVLIRGEINDKQKTELRSALAGIASELENIELVKGTLERIDWVERIDVTLRWPSELLLEVVPETPIAYWNDLGFINQHGVSFASPYLTGFDLPHLHGPEDQIDLVMRTYQQVSQALGPHRIEVLRVLDRGSVEFELDNGWSVLLGSEDLSERLARALAVIQRIQSQNNGIDGLRIDARYPDGVAINGPLPTLDQMWSSNADITSGNTL